MADELVVIADGFDGPSYLRKDGTRWPSALP
jgi:hypothetical protein